MWRAARPRARSGGARVCDSSDSTIEYTKATKRESFWAFSCARGRLSGLAQVDDGLAGLAAFGEQLAKCGVRSHEVWCCADATESKSESDQQRASVKARAFCFTAVKRRPCPANRFG